MKNAIKIIVPLLIGPFTLFSQVSLDRDVIGSAGENSTTPSMEVSWTVGEVAVLTQEPGTITVTEGFQQADGGFADVDELEFDGDITVYPNPVTDQINFKITSSNASEMQGGLFDAAGKEVINIQNFIFENEYEGQIDCTNLPAGKWLLKFYSITEGTSKTFVVIKAN